MPLMRCLCSLIVIVLLFPAGLTGQGRIVLTLEESVALAFKQNPELVVAQNDHAKAQAGIWQAWSTVLPKVDGYVNLQHSWEIQTSRIPNFLKPMLGPLSSMIPGFEQMPDFVDIAFGLENMLRYGATVTQPLFLGGAGMAGIRMANAAERASGHAMDARRQALIHDVATAFYAVLLAQELVRVQENALAQARANLDVVIKKFDVGMASPFDKMRAQVEAANIEPEAIAARNSLRSALSGMRTLLGLDRRAVLDVSGQLTFVEDDLSTALLADLQTIALERRREVRIAEEQKIIADNGISLARSEFWPKLIFQTELSYLGMRDDFRFVGKDFSKGVTSAITLQIPIFSGFSTLKQTEKAQLDYNIALENQRRLLIGVDAEVEVAFNKFKEAEEKYRSAAQTVALGTEALRLARVLYDEGANTQLDVLNSQLALTRAQVNHANSLFEYQTARYQLRRALGMLEGVL